ncbi:hypothetical protein N7478_000427 [Penicillium angulare]|uniref:uncharacterized protein n=1 Tax=Penicillium angulare TaxID=116970 RepID=UPI002541418D|nr:uncharacterized protein N7478_000427 [Penicillium angulare]KAJ5291176.1 hypothetical protein N7478_000427 [Penicillium angulare]
MVNIISASQSVVAAYTATIALTGNYSYPLTSLGDRISTFFLPNYVSFALGDMTVMPNRSYVSEGFQAELTEWRGTGLGSQVSIIDSIIQPVSNESALCWLTYHIKPENGMAPWDWTNVYSYRLTDEVSSTGVRGGFEFNNQDNENLQYAKRFP